MERTYCTPETEAQSRTESPDHWSRYEWAAGYTAGKRVLDVACGCGYGTALLARRAGVRATGLDINQEAVAWARHHFGREADFETVDRAPWPLADASFDLVVSIETLEHVPRPEEFLAEVHRVLSPQGTLILSTPCNETEERFNPGNPFHLREYTWQELAEVLAPRFAIESRWSEVSDWNQLQRSRLGLAVAALKRLLPSPVTRWLRTGMRGYRAGRILQGQHQPVKTQLVIATRR